MEFKELLKNWIELISLRSVNWKRNSQHVLLALALLFQGWSGIGQDRPKIGLALSGGGAKGMAHIGVLRAMEEAGLYPDYITGTSMGSIIGALYAIGWSVDEIEEMARSADWEQLLTNKISLDKVAYEEKNFYGRYLVELPIVKGKVGLPGGLIEGQELTQLLSRITISAHGITDFNDFVIPFACVGTNIETGRAKVFRSGSLPEALRASMAIPSVFTPMEIDGELYVDGGLVRNFPIQEVRDMGADLVIGVFVSDSLAKKQNLNSMVSVLIQSAFVMSAHDSEKQMELADVLIFPDLTGYGTYSFDKTGEIIDRGTDTGKNYLNIFKQLADTVLTTAPKRPNIVKYGPEKFTIDHVKITGNEYVDSELIQGKLRIQHGEEISIDKLEQRINLLYGTRYFEKIVYTIDQHTNTLILRIKEAPRASLKMGVQYDTENEAGLIFNLTLRNFLFRNSRMIAEYDLGDNSRFNFNFFKYLGTRQNIAAALDWVVINSEIPSFWPETEVGANASVVSGLLKENDIGLFFKLQGTFAANKTFGLGIGFLDQKIKPQILDSVFVDIGGNLTAVAFKEIKAHDWITELFFKSNTLDRLFFPTKGIQATGRLGYYFDRDMESSFGIQGFDEVTINADTDHFWQINLTFNMVYPLSSNLALLSYNTMSITNADSDIQYITHRTHIGGFNPRGVSVNPYWGTDVKRFSNMNYFYTGLELRYQMFSRFYLSGMVNYVDSKYPMKLFYNDISQEDLGAYPRRLGFGASLSMNSALGPITFAVAKDQYLDDIQGYINIGFYLRDQ